MSHPVVLALFNDPAALVVDTAGNLFVADRNNLVIRRVTPGRVTTTVAGMEEEPLPGLGRPAARDDGG